MRSHGSGSGRPRGASKGTWGKKGGDASQDSCCGPHKQFEPGHAAAACRLRSAWHRFKLPKWKLTKLSERLLPVGHILGCGRSCGTRHALAGSRRRGRTRLRKHRSAEALDPGDLDTCRHPFSDARPLMSPENLSGPSRDRKKVRNSLCPHLQAPGLGSSCCCGPGRAGTRYGAQRAAWLERKEVERAVCRRWIL